MKAEAEASARSASALAEELIDEGLRMRRHPLVVFRAGPSGRRAGLVGGPDVWEVVAGVVAADVAPAKRVQRSRDDSPAIRQSCERLGIRYSLVDRGS